MYNLCSPHISYLCVVVYFITFYFQDEGNLQSMTRINSLKRKGGKKHKAFEFIFFYAACQNRLKLKVRAVHWMNCRICFYLSYWTDSCSLLFWASYSIFGSANKEIPFGHSMWSNEDSVQSDMKSEILAI